MIDLIRPLFDAQQRVIYYLGIQYDLGRQPAGTGAVDLALDFGRS